MVRLFNRNHMTVFKKLLNGYMQIQKHYTYIYEKNNKVLQPCIYALWHSDQFCLYGMPHKDKLSVLISNSTDGDIIAYAVEGIGIKVLRGSSKRRGAIESTLKMVELLENKEAIAITVDGPNGPLHNVKNGVIRIAKMSGAPIVPVGWYSPQWGFLRFPSWDKMSAPLGPVNIINLYGEPIYVPKDTPQEKEVEYRQMLKSALEDIQNRIVQEYEEAKRNKVWDSIIKEKKQ